MKYLTNRTSRILAAIVGPVAVILGVRSASTSGSTASAIAVPAVDTDITPEAAGGLKTSGAATVPGPATSDTAVSAGSTPATSETMVLAGGCFWGVQGVYEHP